MKGMSTLVQQHKSIFKEQEQEIEKTVKKMNAEVAKHPMAIILPPPLPARFDVKDNFDNALRELEQTHQQVLIEIAPQVEEHLAEMMSAKWSYGDEQRDIVLTGTLRSKGSVEAGRNKLEVSYNNAPYANLVHFGGYIHPYGNQKINQVYIPARPWISATFGMTSGPLPAFDMNRAYANAFKRVSR